MDRSAIKDAGESSLQRAGARARALHHDGAAYLFLGLDVAVRRPRVVAVPRTGPSWACERDWALVTLLLGSFAGVKLSRGRPSGVHPCQLW